MWKANFTEMLWDMVPDRILYCYYYFYYFCHCFLIIQKFSHLFMTFFFKIIFGLLVPWEIIVGLWILVRGRQEDIETDLLSESTLSQWVICFRSCTFLGVRLKEHNLINQYVPLFDQVTSPNYNLPRIYLVIILLSSTENHDLTVELYISQADETPFLNTFETLFSFISSNNHKWK